MTSYHEGVKCNVCHGPDISGLRFTCLVCYNYDLCECCYDERRSNQGHKAYHPMQQILPEGEFFESIDETAPEQMSIYVCPYCDDRELDHGDLIMHCQRYHSDDDTPVRCPICSVYKLRGDVVMFTPFLEHLHNIHGEQLEPIRESSESPECPEGAEEPECTICMEIVSRTYNGRSLPCTHRFHSSCIDRWLQDNPTCPVCRNAA